jgi:hypothetical protein
MIDKPIVCWEVINYLDYVFFVFRFWFHSEKANVVKEESMFEEEEKEEKKDEKLVEHLSLGAILLTDTGKATNKIINKNSQNNNNSGDNNNSTKYLH